MIKNFSFIALISTYFIIFSCEKDSFIGPPIESQYGELIILQPFSSNKPVGVDFSLNDTVRFFLNFLLIQTLILT